MTAESGGLTAQLPWLCAGIIPFLTHSHTRPVPTQYRMPRTRLAAVLALGALFPAARSHAQAWAYPSFQPPRVIVREYNFGIADTDRGGSSLVFQWREQSGPRTQFSFDVGIADTEGGNSDLIAFGGIGLAQRLSAATNEVPIDFLLTGGVYLAIGDVTLLRLPVGLSLGHRFALDDGFAITPYLHPRVSLDICSDCGGSDIGLTFDLGANFQLSRSVSIRALAVFSGSEAFDGDGFGISLAWTPPSLARRR